MGPILPPPPSPDRVPGPERDGRRRFGEVVLVALLALALDLAGNGRTSLWDRDEPLYAGCTREMRSRGDWIRPTFNGRAFYHKPALIYWLMRAGTALAGDSPFGARLPSALAGAATCVVVLAWGRRMFGDRAGLWAALVLATAPIVVIESKLATTDAVLTLLVVACQFALWELARGPSRRAAAVFWTGLALATMTKGPMGPAIVASSAPLAWCWGGSPRGWRNLRWGPGLLWFALLTAPWYAAMQVITGGEFFRVMIGDQVLRRMSVRIEDHVGFPGFYPATGLLAFYPWSALVPAACLGAWARRRQDPTFGFLLGWAIGPVLLLECARTKLLHYDLPCLPAFALLIGWLIAAAARGEAVLGGPWTRRVTRGLLRWVGLGWVVALGLGAWVLPGPMWPACLAAALAAGAGWVFAQRQLAGRRLGPAAAGLVVSWAVLGLIAHAWLLPAAEAGRLTVAVGRGLRGLSAATGAEPVLLGYKPPGVVYLVGHPVPVMRGREGVVQEAGRAGLLVAALLPDEIDALRAEPRLSLETRANLYGFDVERFTARSVVLTLIRPRGSVASANRPREPGRREGPPPIAARRLLGALHDGG